MPITRAGCVDPTPDYVFDQCNVINSRVVAIAIGLSDHGVTDWADPVQVDAAITAGKLDFIKGFRGTPDTMSPVEVAGYGKEDTRVVGATHELTGVIPYNCDNVAFYNAVNQGTWSFFAMIHQNGEMFTVTDKGVSIFVGKEGPEDLTGILDGTVTVKWSDSDHAVCEATILAEQYFC